MKDESRKSIKALYLLLVFASTLTAIEIDWNLPIKLNDKTVVVYEKLGIPNELHDTWRLVDGTDIRKDLKRWGMDTSITLAVYYEKGLRIGFRNKRVVLIAINSIGDSKEKVYDGFIVNGLRICDSRDTLLAKLGHPDDIETTGKPASDTPSVWPSLTTYVWHSSEFTISVDIREQKQIIDSKKNSVANANTINFVHLSLPRESKSE